MNYFRYHLGYYLYLNASVQLDQPERAVIESVPFEPTAGTCMSFWYIMTGTNVDRMSIYMKSETTLRELKWVLIGEQSSSDTWQHGQVPLYSKDTFQVIFFVYLSFI